MGHAKRKAVLALALAMLVANGGLPLLTDTGDPGAVADSPGFAPFLKEFYDWSDDLDDTTHVYIPPGGLVGVEVTDGEARLFPGTDQGWIASEVIECLDEYRYDMLFLQVETPGASSLKVSVLNASADPTEVGFANDTISGFKLLSGNQVSLTTISPYLYPRIRIQVNLFASGTDRPSLLWWRVRFSDHETWYDGFDNTLKISDHQGLNMSLNQVMLNLSGPARGGGEYDPYPPVAIPRYQALHIFYPSAGGTGYKDVQLIDIASSSGTHFDDVDGDGYMDLVVACPQGSSKVLWGTTPGRGPRRGRRTSPPPEGTRWTQATSTGTISWTWRSPATTSTATLPRWCS